MKQIGKGAMFSRTTHSEDGNEDLHLDPWPQEDVETLEQKYVRKYPSARIPPMDLTSTRMEKKPYYFIHGNTIQEGILGDTRDYHDRTLYCLISINGNWRDDIDMLVVDKGVQLVEVFDKIKVQELDRRNMEGDVFSQNKVLPTEITGVINAFNKGGRSKRKRKRKTKRYTK